MKKIVKIRAPAEIQSWNLPHINQTYYRYASHLGHDAVTSAVVTLLGMKYVND
jgi:hypothetical protein